MVVPAAAGRPCPKEPRPFDLGKIPLTTVSDHRSVLDYICSSITECQVCKSIANVDALHLGLYANSFVAFDFALSWRLLLFRKQFCTSA